jgi:hypothetical protein
MYWAEEDLRTEVAISTSAAGNNDPLKSTRNAEPVSHQARSSTLLATSRRKIRPVSADAENRPGCGKLQGRTGFELTRAASIDSFL